MFTHTYVVLWCEVHRTVLMKSHVLWNYMPCRSMNGSQCFGGACCLRVQDLCSLRRVCHGRHFVFFLHHCQTVCDTVYCNHLDFIVHCLISMMWSQYSWLNSHINCESADGPVMFLVMTWRSVLWLFLWARIENKCYVHWIIYFSIYFMCKMIRLLTSIWVCSLLVAMLVLVWLFPKKKISFPSQIRHNSDI